MSGFKCKGMVTSQEAFTKVFETGGEDFSAMDPEGIMLTKTEDDYANLKSVEALAKKKEGENPTPLTWEDVVGVCKEWNEVKEHGKAFCCMGMSAMGELQETPFIVDATEVEKQDPLTLGDDTGSMKMEFYAEILGGAAAKLGVVTSLVATMVFMN